MKLDELKEIKEADNEEQVNKLLKQGFYIIKIVKVRNVEDEKLVYCLGK